MNQKITITIEQENAAFDGEMKSRETARILRKLADDIESGKEPEMLFDINGNKVGTVSIF